MDQTTNTPGSLKGASDAAVTLRVFNPVGFVQVDPVQPADRLTDLNNKRVGLYWNRKHRGDVALKAVEDLFGSRFTNVEFTWFERDCCSALQPNEIRIIKEAKNDLIVSTTGD